MQFLDHLLDDISGYGHLSQYSTHISERALRKQIKDAWRKSNYIDVMEQILKYGGTYRSMMKIKSEIELGTTSKPE